MNGGRWTDRYCDDGRTVTVVTIFVKICVTFYCGKKKTDYWGITVVDNVIDSNEEVTE